MSSFAVLRAFRHGRRVAKVITNDAPDCFITIVVFLDQRELLVKKWAGLTVVHRPIALFLTILVD